MPAAADPKGLILSGSLTGSGSPLHSDRLPSLFPGAPHLYVDLDIGSATQVNLVPYILGPDNATWFPVHDAKGTQFYADFVASFAGVTYPGVRTSGLNRGKVLPFLGPSVWRLSAETPDPSVTTPATVTVSLVEMDPNQDSILV